MDERQRVYAAADQYDLGNQTVEHRVRAANCAVDRPETPIDHAIERIRQIENIATELTARLERNADAISGPVPQSENAEGARGVVSGSSLFERLDCAISSAQHAMNQLAEATGRNCWAA